ncbi:hypothetical protein KIPB_014531, partial [Kipferlia bialata]
HLDRHLSQTSETQGNTIIKEGFKIQMSREEFYDYDQANKDMSKLLTARLREISWSVLKQRPDETEVLNTI